MENTYPESNIRKILRSEITWTVTTIALIMGFVKTVVIPINNLQIQVAAVQTQLLDEKTKYDDIKDALNDVSDKTNETKTRLDEHIRMTK